MVDAGFQKNSRHLEMSKLSDHSIATACAVTGLSKGSPVVCSLGPHFEYGVYSVLGMYWSPDLGPIPRAHREDLGVYTGLGFGRGCESVANLFGFPCC